jgi:uncharacterized membrane protein
MRKPSLLLVIDIITVLLVLATTFTDLSFIRIILGLPFLLFFPGYVLVSALFPGDKGPEVVGRISLSVAISLASIGLIAFGLNYTPNGITLQKISYSVGAFVLVVSSIAMIRQRRISYQSAATKDKPNIELLDWRSTNKSNKALIIILGISIIAVIASLGFLIATPKPSEAFTEFYVLGDNGQAQGYPSNFIMEQGSVVGVEYGTETIVTKSNLGEIKLTIVNHEQNNIDYTVTLSIDGQPTIINYAGNNVSQLEVGTLGNGATWSGEIGFAPQHIGNGQDVDILLFKVDSSTPIDSLQLQINVSAAP